MRSVRLGVGTLVILTATACGRESSTGPHALSSEVAASASVPEAAPLPTSGTTPSSDRVLTAVAATPNAREDADISAASRTERRVTLDPGTVVAVRLDRSLSTARNRAGSAFHAVLDAPIVVDGRDVLARGTRFTGHVTRSEQSGRLRGRAELAITLDAVNIDGRSYPITTSVSTRSSAAHTKRNVEFIGGGSGVGALIGGLTGGKKGVAIGAAVGAGAGTGAAAATGTLNVVVPAEQLYRFSLTEPVSLPN